MKKRLALVLAGAAAMSTLGVLAAHADNATATTPVGSANVDASGITLDGNSTNPDPLDGYVIIGSDHVSCAADGGPYNDDGTAKNTDGDPNNDFSDPNGCNPSVPGL